MPAAADLTLAQIARHPVRVSSFLILDERVASPSELAQLLQVPIGRVAYHVRDVLHQQLGAVEIVGEARRRGAVEHFYRAVDRPLLDGDDWNSLSLEERKRISRDVLFRAIADLSHAWEAETLDARPDHALIRLAMVVDKQGFGELTDLHREKYEAALEIQKASSARQAVSGEEGIHVIHLGASFERGPLHHDDS